MTLHHAQWPDHQWLDYKSQVDSVQLQGGAAVSLVPVTRSNKACPVGSVLYSWRCFVAQWQVEDRQRAVRELGYGCAAAPQSACVWKCHAPQ